MQLVLFGTSYKKAGVEQRGRLACDQDLEFILNTLKSENGHILEVAIISTCNRVEVYAITKDLAEARKTIVNTLCQLKDFPEQELEDISYTYYNKFAAEHLYRVTAGLDSMVLGENEILKQVKLALQFAQSANTTGKILNKLFQLVIESGKRIRTETSVNQGCVSIASIASNLIQESDVKKVLLIGTGQMGEVVLKNLSQLNQYEFVIANRTQEKALVLAKGFSGSQVISLDQISDVLPDVQATVVCTSAPHYVLTKEHVVASDVSSKALFIDLSVPRNIDPEIQSEDLAVLYNMDDLETVIQNNFDQRKNAMGHVESILAEEMARLVEWLNTLDVVPAIQSLFKMVDDIREREIERALKKYDGDCDDETLALVERVTRSITQKILYYPVVQLKMESNPNKKQMYLDALTDIFKLDAQDVMDKYIYQSKRHARSLKPKG